MSQLTTQTPPTLLADTARRDLAQQLDSIEQLTQQRNWHIAKFYCMVLVLREEAEGVYSHGENKPIAPSARGGRPLQPTDLKSIFASAGIAVEKHKSAYRWFSKGEEMHAVYAQSVGAKFAKAMPMADLVNTPASELAAEAREKQQTFFDFLAAEREPKPRRQLGGDTTPKDGSVRPRADKADQAQAHFHGLQELLFRCISPASIALTPFLPSITDEPDKVASLTHLIEFTSTMKTALQDALKIVRGRTS
jgi:hypothetical protein